jgi:hypothetical protein
MSARPVKVRVIYKSGATFDFDCADLITKKNAFGALASVEWEDAWPKPIAFGLDDVAAIWRLK